VLLELRSLRKAPFRVAWQEKAPAGKESEYLESGVEFTSETDLWAEAFSSSKAKPAGHRSTAKNPLSPKELLEEALQASAFQPQQRERFLEHVWSGLVEQLEESGVFTRAELVAYLRKIGQV